jgi:hypothetical protein
MLVLRSLYLILSFKYNDTQYVNFESDMERKLLTYFLFSLLFLIIYILNFKKIID